jgi:hypothetical protein
VECSLRQAGSRGGRRPWSLVAWRNYSAIGGPEIDYRRQEFLMRPGADPKQIEKEYRDAKARERDGERAVRAWDKRAGLTEQRRGLARVKTKPTTPAGAAAMLGYLKADMESGDTKWRTIALDTITKTPAGWR